MRKDAEGGEFDGLFIRFSRHGWYGTVRRIFWIWIRRVRYFRNGYAECTWVGVMMTINLLTVGKSGLDGGLRGWADGG